LAVLLYNVFLFFLKTGIRVSSLFNEKARKWLKGRRDIFQKLEQAIPGNDKIIWMHCASLGEFEQGRPLLEELKRTYPAYKILLTFFSPSGYEAQKNYPGANWIFYLPVDGPANARRFLEIVHPSLVIFVKYEFWYYYLKKIKYRNIPLLLVSALFRKDMSFFTWYGGLQRKMLSRFDHLFVQNYESLQLMKNIGLENISSVSGDTRFDRVIEIASKPAEVKGIKEFAGEEKIIVAGSTWKEDEELIAKVSPLFAGKLKWIIAPHEVSAEHLDEIKKLFPGALFYSEFSKETNKQISTGKAVTLVIDTIGLLSRLYRYADITYVGGGLRKMGVHNVLEAAVYSKPVLFGNFYHKYTEAVELVKAGGGLPFADAKKDGQVMTELLNGLLSNPDEYNYCSCAAGNFVRSKQGATKKIVGYIQEKRLLTS
jgi:3-deoxy-D-manno-octulosonic-acid transferase